MAVKERSPGRPTMYAGFTNGLIAYFATAAEYAYGGYEADYSRRGHGNPGHVAPECEQILVENGVRAAEELFPAAEPWDAERRVDGERRPPRAAAAGPAGPSRPDLGPAAAATDAWRRGWTSPCLRSPRLPAASRPEPHHGRVRRLP